MPDIMHELVIKAAPDRIFDAIATQEGLSAWWTRDTEAEPKVGSLAVFGFGNRATIFRMAVRALDRPGHVEWSCQGDHPEWAGTRVTFDLKPLANGKETTVRFTHGDWRSADGWMAPCSYTWAHVLARLKSYSETGERSPYFPG